MIRIINEAPHHSVVKQCICRNCGVTLEYTPNDLLSFVHHDYGGGKDTVKYINCPRCSNQVNVR